MHAMPHDPDDRGEVRMNEIKEHREDINPPMRPVEKMIIGALVVIVVVAVLALLGIHP